MCPSTRPRSVAKVLRALTPRPGKQAARLGIGEVGIAQFADRDGSPPGGLVSRRIIALRDPPKDTGCLLAGLIRRPRGTVATDGVSALSALCGTIKEHVGHGVAALPTRPKAHHRSIPNLGIWWYRPNVLQTNPLTQDASATHLGNR